MPIDWTAELAAAERRTGLTTWGGEGFHAGLAAFTEAINCDPDMPEPTRRRVQAQIAALLDQRLRLYADRRAFPQIAEQHIVRPLIVIGLPRSGTTFLHALLAQDPRARSPLAWEVGQLSPPPRRETHDTDPRIAAAQARLDQLPLAFRQMHMVGATLPDECNALTMLAFQSSNLSAANRIPGYVDWYLAADDKAPYELHRHVLQHLQAFCPGEWWVLKSPPHMFHLPRLLATYPDARIVFPHRDPAAALPSLASLITHLREGAYGEGRPQEVGPEMASYWREALGRALALRSDPAQAERFVDVSYAALTREPMAVVRAIYDHFGLPLTPEAEAAMTRFLDEQPKDKHGAHRYALEDFGLTAAGVRRQFADYIDAYLANSDPALSPT